MLHRGPSEAILKNPDDDDDDDDDYDDDSTHPVSVSY